MTVLIGRRFSCRALCCIGWLLVNLGCSREDPTTSANKTDQLSNTPNASSALADSIKKSAPLISESTETVSPPLPDNVDELFRILARKQGQQRGVMDRQAIYDIQDVRQRVATKLLKMDLDVEQRYQAVRAKLDALLRLTSIGDIDAPEKLQQFATNRIADKDQRIVQGASIALLVNEMTQRIKASPTGDLQPVIDQSKALAERFPQSFEVCRELLDLAEGLIQLKRRDEALQIMAMLADIYSVSQDQRLKNMAAAISRRVQLAELDFDRIMNQVRENHVGAMNNYQQVVTSLLNDQRFDNASFQEVAKSLHWLEFNRLYEEARQANQIVDNAADAVADDELKNAVKRYCDWQSKRLRLLNQPFQFEASTAMGEKVDWQRYQDKVIIVAFWSTSEPASMQLLKYLELVRQQNKGRGLELMAINLSHNLKPLATLFEDGLPEWDIVVSDRASGGRLNALAEQFGVSRVPFVALVDRQGAVTNINVTQQELQTQIDTLLGESPNN